MNRSSVFSPRGVMSNSTEVPFHSPVSLTKYRYKDVHRSTRTITEMVPGRRVIWRACAAPSWSVTPSISPDHQARTLFMAANTASGDWSTVKAVMKSLSLMAHPVSWRRGPIDRRL